MPSLTVTTDASDEGPAGRLLIGQTPGAGNQSARPSNDCDDCISSDGGDGGTLSDETSSVDVVGGG